MYAVHTGRVELRTGHHVLEVVGSGGVFGEMILVGRFERSATAIALEDCQLVPIDQSRFDRIIQRYPNLARELMWLMAERLTAMNERLKTGG
jgi:CRP-like cAMP-binding protein